MKYAKNPDDSHKPDKPEQKIKTHAKTPRRKGTAKKTLNVFPLRYLCGFAALRDSFAFSAKIQLFKNYWSKMESIVYTKKD